MVEELGPEMEPGNAGKRGETPGNAGKPRNAIKSQIHFSSGAIYSGRNTSDALTVVM